MLLFLIAAAFSTIAVTMLELGIRSAVLSPSILLDAKKEEVHKLLIGYSIYQGDYQLEIQKVSGDSSNYSLSFHIRDTDYRFSKVEMENVTFLAGEEMTVLTRRGVEPSFSDEVTIQSSERNFFFNEYTIRVAKKMNHFLFN